MITLYCVLSNEDLILSELDDARAALDAMAADEGYTAFMFERLGGYNVYSRTRYLFRTYVARAEA